MPASKANAPCKASYEKENMISQRVCSKRAHAQEAIDPLM